MATYTPGTGGTLKSTTLENAFHEALNSAINFEKDTAKNPQNQQKIGLSINAVTRSATGSFTFSLTKEITTAGTISFPVTDYFTTSGFTPGTGSTIKSANLPAAIVELAELLQTREQNSTKNPQNLNTITSLNYDSEALTVDCTFAYNLDAAMATDGGLSLKAKTYLAD